MDTKQFANILVTGAAGFIWFSLARRLLREGVEVVGVDNLNSYYEVSLKEARLSLLCENVNFGFSRIDLTDRAACNRLFKGRRFDAVIHLAAQAGVRYSIENPMAYIDSNLVGFANVIEAARAAQVKHFLFASSSSVYGGLQTLPFAETDRVDRPITVYAATKKCNELIAHSYSHLFGLPTTGLRFFTVYGPWGRPDMALFKFTRELLAGRAIPVFNHGRMIRDFTYIDDVVEAIVRLIRLPPTQRNEADCEADEDKAAYRILNIGNSRPVELLDYIRALESSLGRRAQLDLMPMQPGDLPKTMADASRLVRTIGYQPSTSVEEGVRLFVDWYLDYYGEPGTAPR